MNLNPTLSVRGILLTMFDKRNKLSSQVDKEAAIIRAKADKEAAIIIGNAEAEAIKILSEAHSLNTDFYKFLRQLETYQNSFAGGNTTIIVPKNSNLLDSFFGSNLNTTPFPAVPKID